MLGAGVHRAEQGCLQGKQEVDSFLPVFVPIAANFLWEERAPRFVVKEKISICKEQRREHTEIQGAEGFSELSLG